jgi:hypothetical protein
MNAKLRLLSGGRSRQDIKRGFAIVESSGMTRYFVARNAQEFLLWSKEIASSIRAYSDADIVAEMEREIKLAMSSMAPSKDELEEDDGVDENGQRKRGIGKRLASVYQSAKQKSKSLSERRGRASSTDSLDYLDVEEDDAQSSGLHDDVESNSNTNYEESTDSDGNALKRVQIGKKFSVVGQATKNRLGSAIQSARQKGTEISNRRRRVDGESDVSFRGDSSHDGSIDAPLDLIAENSDSNRQDEIGDNVAPEPRRARQLGNKLGSAFQNARNKVKETSEKQGGRLGGIRGKIGGLAQNRSESTIEGSAQQNSPQIDTEITVDNVASFWTCESCTFINHSVENERMVCEMCGAERKTFFTPTMSNETKALPPPSPSNTQNSGLPSSQSQNSLGDNSQGPVGAESFNRSSSFDQNNTRRNPRFNFRKRQEEASDDSIFGGEPFTLKNVHVSNQVPPGLGSLDLNDIPLKKFEGDWTVVVNQLATKDTGKTAVAEEKSNIDNLEDGLESDAHFQGNVPFPGDAKGYSESNKTPKEDGESTQDLEPTEKPDESILENKLVVSRQDVSGFKIQVFRTQTMLHGPEFEKVLTLGDILKLYSEISEAIDPVLPRLAAKETYEGRQNTSLADGNLSTTDLIEKVLIFGRILGGLLQDFGDHSEHVRKYQRECIEEFINSLLGCALPIEALSSLSEIIGISASTKDIETDHLDVKDGKGLFLSEQEKNTVDVLSRDRVASVMRLLSVCEAEFQRAENNEAVIVRSTQKEPDSLATPNCPKIAKPSYYQPLLPPSFTNIVHDSIHEALMDTMAERDEAHAQLIGSNVMHLHSLERERKKNEKLELDIKMRQEIARIRGRQDLQQPNIANFFGKPDDRVEKMRKEIDLKIEAFHTMYRSNSAGEEEMTQLTNQLSSEISAKTAHALEIERLKKVRETEQKTAAAEREAMKEELERVKELLAAAEKETADALKEAEKWKALYEDQVRNGHP